MICPRCKSSFSTRQYSSKDKSKTVKCIYCNKTFTAPQRADIRRLIKEILTDDLFDTDEWRNADTVRRVQILVDAAKTAR